MAFDDYFTAGNSIADTIGEAAKHLTLGQRTVLIGAVAAWIDHAVMAEREACATVAEEFEDDMGDGKAQKIADAIRMRSNA